MKLPETKALKVQSRLHKLVIKTTTEAERILLRDGFKYFLLEEMR